MPSLVVEVMQAHKEALLRQERGQMAAMSRRWLQLERELQDQVELFVRRVQMDGLTPGQLQSRRFQLDRYRSLLSQVRGQLDQYSDYAGDLITTRQGEIGRAAIRAASAAIEATGADSGIKVAFDRLPVSAIENMIGLAGDGSPLRDLLTDSYGAGADGMLNQLIRATTLGHNPQVTARAMLRNGLSQSLSRMLNIARTEQLRVGREATRQAYQESGVVEAMRRLATKDSRACVACLLADGETIPLDESLREHPQGRCTTIPIVSGLPLAEWEKGRDWFAKADPATQRKILGNGKFTAWRDGRFDLDQLIQVRENSTWGDTLQPASLADLLAGNARPFVVRQPDPDRDAGGSIVRQPEPEPEREVAPIFTDRKEAQKWADQRFPFQVNYGKLDVDAANVFNQSLLENIQRAPRLEEAVKYVGSSQARNKDIKEYYRPQVEKRVRDFHEKVGYRNEKGTQKEINRLLNQYVRRVPGNTYAYSVYNPNHAQFDGISINEKYGKSLKAMEQSLASDVRSGFHPIGCDTVKSVVDHELAHEIDKIYGLVNDPEFLRRLDRIKRMEGGIADNLSRYATTNDKEVIAEAWAEYLNNPEPREPARLIGELIEQKARGQ